MRRRKRVVDRRAIDSHCMQGNAVGAQLLAAEHGLRSLRAVETEALRFALRVAMPSPPLILTGADGIFYGSFSR